MKNKPEIDDRGTKKWRNSKGQFHREDGPAIEYPNGHKEWWINGKKHREDGPAIEYYNGIKVWWINGNRHREDGPAIEYASGTKEWYINGKLHREDGPAVEYTDGAKAWYVNGKLHREDGPAVEYTDGTKEWYINGKRHLEEEFEGLELIQEILNNIGFNISKMNLVSNMQTNLNKTTLTILDTEINLCDPNSLNQIKNRVKHDIDKLVF